MFIIAVLILVFGFLLIEILTIFLTCKYTSLNLFSSVVVVKFINT